MGIGGGVVEIVAIFAGVDIDGGVLGGGSMCDGDVCGCDGIVKTWVWCLLLLSKCLALLITSIFLAKFYFL